MKKFLSILLVFVMMLTCFVSCKNNGDENETTPPTNEELIAGRIETFLTAYNTGDMDAVIECFDAKTRNAVQAMLNLFGGIAGGAAGFDIDLSDLFSLGVSTIQGDFMGLEITDINVLDHSNATATTIMNLMGEETQTFYFEMVYENDDWYIHDMTDRKLSGTNDHQGGNSNNGDSADTDGDSNDGDSADTDEDTKNDTSDPIDSSYRISSGEPFVDERAWVTYYKPIENQYAQTDYYGFIDLQGNVIYSVLAEDVDIYNIGKGSAIITSETELVLINKSGEVKMRLNGQAEVKAYGNGFAWIYQNKSTITSSEHLYGIVNHAGEWIEPLQNLQEKGLCDTVEYIGDGFFGTKEWRDGVVYPIWNPDKSVQITLDGICVDCSIDFSNGMAFVSRSIYCSDTVYITVMTNEGKNNEKTQTYEISNDCIIFADGRVVDVGGWLTILNYNWTFYDGKVVTNEKICLEGGQYYQITDYTQAMPVTVEFTAYPASQIEDFVFNGNYGLVQICGLDEKTYVTMIDAQGNELITPIKGMHLEDFVLAPNGYAYYRQDGVYYIVDKDDHVTKTDKDAKYWDVSFDIGGEFGICWNYFYGISYIKPNGDNLFENLTV